jgi:hypothetical protein
MYERDLVLQSNYSPLLAMYQAYPGEREPAEKLIMKLNLRN